MHRLGLIVKWAVLLPLLLAVVLLAVANDHAVTVRLNPFDPADPQLSYEIALYQLGFLVFVAGVLFGAVVAWGGARRRRRTERRGDPAASDLRASKGQATALLPRS